jgi:RNA polymerase sigma-70 factor (ECF subfamily)
MNFLERLTDAELLERTAREPQAFATLYRRHEQLVLRYLLSRCHDAELAADLAAETFASILEAAPRFDATRTGGSSALPWILAIARHTLLASVRRGTVADEARRRLRLAPVELTDAALARVEELASIDFDLNEILRDLPLEQREAIVARVLDERDYDEIAAQLGCSQMVVRKRVSRGLKRLRTVLLSAGN